MSAILPSFAALVCLTAGVQDNQKVTLLFEGGFRSQFSEELGVITLRGGAGRLRTSGPLSDFSLAFDFRVESPEAEAGVFIRTLTGGPDGTSLGNSVYEIGLSDGGWAEPSAALSAVKGKATVKSRGHVERRGAGEWQRLNVVATGPDVSIILNGSVVAAFEVADLVGHILFQTKSGAIKLRNIVIVPRGSIARVGADGVSVPKILRAVRHRYPPDAMNRRAQGTVELEALILTDGSVGAVKVVKSVDAELDQSAVETAWQRRFTPAMQNGVPVPVLMRMTVSFTFKN